MIRIALLALLLAVVTIPAHTQSAAECAHHLSPCHVDTRLSMAGIEDNQDARDFISRLKSAARSGDRRGLAALVRYPLTMYEAGEQGMTFEIPAELLRNFESVFTPGVLRAIEAAEYQTLFVNDQGAMIGDGEIWFDGWEGRVLIKTVNPPDASAAERGPDSGSDGAPGSVLWAQTKLNGLGYDAGPQDGQIGRRTRRALASFQGDNGLEVTSLIDRETVAALAATERTGGPSFDCRKAKAPIERAICASPVLSRLDAELAAAFQSARDGLAAADAALELERQRAWLAERNRCGNDVSCLEASYRDRIAELGSQASGQAAELSEQTAPAQIEATETITILGAEFPVAPSPYLNEIPAEWEPARDYVPEWLHAAPDGPIDDAGRLRLLEELEADLSGRVDPELKRIAERHLADYLELWPDRSRDYFELELAGMCFANDPGGYITRSTLALCQEYLALSFLVAIVRTAHEAQEENPPRAVSDPAAEPVAAPAPATMQPGSEAARPSDQAFEPTAVEPAAKSAPQPLETFKDCDTCPEMVVLPAGSYWMGATEEDAKLPYTEWNIPTESPRHEVTLDYSFAIGKFEVTVTEFAAFVDETGFEAGGECHLRIPSTGPNKGKFIGKISANATEYERAKHGLAHVVYADFRKPGIELTDGNQPATCISRNEANAYMAWLSGKSGRKYRLPTEAEWEYAARAGETKPFYYGGGEEELCDYANFGDKDSVYGTGALGANCAEKPSPEYTRPVGGFKPNNWGLFDMVGNVFEFVEDCYFPNYEGAPADGSPWMKSDLHSADFMPQGKCIGWGTRGYFFDSLDTTLRSATRCHGINTWDERSNGLGLRVAVSMTDEAWDLK